VRRKLIFTVGTIFTVAAVCIGAVSDQKLVSWVQARVRKFEPTKADRTFDQIGWASSITEALRLAKENNKPVFLFTHDGQIETGRC
jgi:hypothetical protein